MKEPKDVLGQVRAWWRIASSWELLRRLFPWSETLKTPPAIASREHVNVSSLLGGVNLLTSVPTPLLVIAGALYVAALIVSRSPSAPMCINGLLLAIPLALLIPSLLLWALPLALALAPLIAREREAQTWEILRATPYTPEEILLSRAQVALVALRRALRPVWQVQMHVLAAILIGGGVMVLLSGGLLVTTDAGTLTQQNLLCFGALFVTIAALVAYVADRIQQFVLMVVATLAASASAASVRKALTAAIAAAFVTWGVDVGFGVALLLAQPAGEIYDLGFSVVTMVLLGPPMGYLLELPGRLIVLIMALTLTARAVALRVLWGVAVRQAERI